MSDSDPEEIITYKEMEHDLWRQGDLSYFLDDLQTKIRDTIYASNQDEVCILSSRQIGKSFLICVIVLEYLLRNPGRIARILAPTLKQVSDIVNDNLNKILIDAPPGLVERQKSDYRWNFSNGSSLRLGALERAHVDNNRGGNATLIAYEEGGFVSSEDYSYAVNSVIGPQLTRSRKDMGEGREIHLTTPSEDEFHYVHDVVRPKCEENGTFFSYTIHDSPSISPEQIQKVIERCGGETSEAFRREYLAEVIRSPSLMVIPEFDETRHVTEFELPDYYKSCIVWDMGGTLDRTGILSLAWDWQSQRLLVWDERLFEPNTPTREVVIQSREMEKVFNWEDGHHARWADMPSTTDLDLSDKKAFNYPMNKPPKDDVDAQINILRLRFVHDKILIHSRCKKLIQTLKVARYNSRRTDFERHQLYGHFDLGMALVYGERVIDKMTIPFPEKAWNKEHTLYIPNRARDTALENLAKEFAPYDPLRRIKRHR
jgi:hypothetical protein